MRSVVCVSLLCIGNELRENDGRNFTEEDLRHQIQNVAGLHQQAPQQNLVDVFLSRFIQLYQDRGLSKLADGLRDQAERIMSGAFLREAGKLRYKGKDG